MKKVRFTQNIILTVTVDVEMPDDWDSQEFADDWVCNITVDEPNDGFIGEYTIHELVLDGAELTDATVWSD